MSTTKKGSLEREREIGAVSTSNTTSTSASTSNSIPPSLPSTPSTLHKARQALSKPFRKTPIFPKFMLLPLEIRLQIWEATMEPRVHELHPCSKLYNERMTFRSNSSLTPSIFHTCSESRAVALKHYQLMDYQPPAGGASGKGILRFYFSPKHDTLLLNSLMGLFVMFMLLEDDEDYPGMGGLGTMKGWERVAFDAERATLITLLSGFAGNAPQPRFKAIFPSLKQLTIAFDYNSRGKTRFRTSVWPGENGTSLIDIDIAQTLTSDTDSAVEDRHTMTEAMVGPMKEYLDNDFRNESGGVPKVKIAKVKRKPFIRGDIRYAFRKSCAFVGLKPRWVFRRL